MSDPESGATPSSAAGDMPQPESAYKRHICMAITSGDWVEASSYYETHPDWVSIPLTEDGDRALHIAVTMEHTSFVEKLVQLISMQDMEIPDADGNTAFCMAAISGNVAIAKILHHNNRELVWIPGHNGMLPIQLAFSAGQLDMVKFLFESTFEDMATRLSDQDILRLFFLALTYNIYTMALTLLRKYPRFAIAENESELTAFEMLAQLSFDKDAPDYRRLLDSLFKLVVEEEDFSNPERMSRTMFNAAKSGNVKILEFILKYNPKLLTKMNSEGHTLLHIAILYRQVPIYQLILSTGAYKNVIVQKVDRERNNVLHLAGKLVAEGRFGSINQVLILSEELWFKEVEKIVPPELKTMRNAEGLTPKELFYREHKELTEKAISELNEMANNFIVVGTLILTMGISAAFTIRTNRIRGETPLLQEKTWDIIFLISIVLGVGFSALSMIFYTSAILRSTWKQKASPVTSRLLRIACADLLLSLSMGVMITFSCASGAFLIYYDLPIWILGAIAALTFIPVAFLYFAFMYAWPLKGVLILVLAEEVGIFSRIGSKWSALYYVG